MKMLITILATALLFLFQNNITITATLSGKLLDEESGEPILFGTVALYQNNKLVEGKETDLDGKYEFKNLKPGVYDVEAAYLGYSTKREKDVKLKENEVKKLDIKLGQGVLIDEVVVTRYEKPLIDLHFGMSGNSVSKKPIKYLPKNNVKAMPSTVSGLKSSDPINVRGSRSNATVYYIDGVRANESLNGIIPTSELKRIKIPISNDDTSREDYTRIEENKFLASLDESVSTFSIDVDRAAYSNVRRYLDRGSLPPADAVRIEEMINYFDYQYKGPKGQDPFAIHTTVTECPWNEFHNLVHIGLQGKKIDASKLPPSNLVFLIDMSGSMNSRNKLPLVVSSLKLLVDQLRPEDRIAIVGYAGSAGLKLASTPISNKKDILKVLDNIRAGGSTAGAAGILLAYDIARKHFMQNGNNRVILATDGDFNVGVSSKGGLEKLIEKERKSGIFLSVLGFGMGNYQDGKIQTLADKGNGNHAYIDDIDEAKKIFKKEFTGTLYTLAKDVKIQIDFNPNLVSAYRLVGYENRMLENKDFEDDKKDAGELGVGHTVTAIYEVIPAGVEDEYTDALDTEQKYLAAKPANRKNLAEIRFRYKAPDGHQSRLITKGIKNKKKELRKSKENVGFASAVAAFGMLLRNSDYVKNMTYDEVIALAKAHKGKDKDGYRKECIEMMQMAKRIQLETVASK